ncbi:MAG: efflux transporter, family, subunit [Ignavibacteria bacterium]|nr:efflux transporter, family, subunit [Ignavibacteria bacterium]
MKKAIYIFVSIAIIALIILILFFNKKTAVEKVYHYDKQQQILITTETAEQRLLSVELNYTGIFEPVKEVKVMAESQGKINNFNSELGDYLKEGDLIVQLDVELLKLQLEAIDIQIDGYEKDVKRYTILTQADAVQGIQLEKSQLALKGAEVQRKTILEQIKKSSIKSPIDGIVTQKFTELGAVVSPFVPIVQITDISSVLLSINVPESDLKHFELRQQVEVVSDIYPDIKLSGIITMIGSKGDMAHNFPLQIRVNNKAQKIKSGMFGTAKIYTGNKQTFVVIPIKALFGSSKEQQVYVINDGKSLLRNIFVSFRSGQFVAVSSGLKAGEIVATSGFINLKNGSPVKFNLQTGY